jgi:cell division protein FtsI/penicillin-binding protein 2
MAPLIRPEESWYPIDLATAGFGQGISVTPIELISAFASLANDGKRMEPHVVDKVEIPNGEIINIPPKTIDQPVSARTAAIMREILVNAVKNGEAKWVAPKGYRIAGKTGTAQIPIAGHYDSTNTIASFIGFAPADDPRFVMLIIYNRPTTSIYGAETAAPTFFEVAQKLLAYYGIPTTEPME